MGGFIYLIDFLASMGIAKVTTNYQVTIPRDVRKIKNIKVGDTVLFTIEGSRVDFFKVSKPMLVRETAGIWKTKGSGTEYVNEIRKSWKKRAERLGL